jgi:hypothetical protein
MEGLIRASSDATSSLRAFRHLLKVLCDAFVRVDGDGRVLSPTPHFCHLLGVGMDTSVEHTLFRDHLASETDKHGFDQIVMSTAARGGALPAALHVHLVHRSGATVPVQLLCASLPEPDGQSGYLIGILETKVVPEIDSGIAHPEFDEPIAHAGKEQQIWRNDPRRWDSALFDSILESCSMHSLGRESGYRELTELESIEIEFDAADQLQTLQRCSFHFADTSEQPSRSKGSGMRSMLSWVHSSMTESFVAWVQEWTNAIAYDRPLPAFGPLTLRYADLGGVSLCAHSVMLAKDSGRGTSRDGDSDGSSSSASGDEAYAEDAAVKILVTLKLQKFSQVRATGITNASEIDDADHR